MKENQFHITRRYHPFWQTNQHMRLYDDTHGPLIRTVKVYHRSWLRKLLHKCGWKIKTIRLKVEYV